jgi:hypothetical protein
MGVHAAGGFALSLTGKDLENVELWQGWPVPRVEASFLPLFVPACLAGNFDPKDDAMPAGTVKQMLGGPVMVVPGVGQPASGFADQWGKAVHEERYGLFCLPPGELLVLSPQYDALPGGKIINVVDLKADLAAGPQHIDFHAEAAVSMDVPIVVYVGYRNDVRAFAVVAAEPTDNFSVKK